MISEIFENKNCDLRGLEPRERLSSGLPFLECWSNSSESRTSVSSPRGEGSRGREVERSRGREVERTEPLTHQLVVDTRVLDRVKLCSQLRNVVVDARYALATLGLG